MLIESYDNEYFLYVHFDDGLSDEGGPEKGPKWHQKVAARDAGQIEQGVWNASAHENAEKADLLDDLFHGKFATLEHAQLVATDFALLQLLDLPLTVESLPE